MKYVALLRGINVGGNSIIKMADLRKAVENAGYANVMTYIQSGNVIFDSASNDQEKIAKDLEEIIYNTFAIVSRVVIRSLPQMKNILSHIPDSWEESDLRTYVAFIKEPMIAAIAAKEIPVRIGVDLLDIGDGVLYMATKTEGLTKSGFTKIVGTKIYKDMTLRNRTTTQKLLALMEE